MIDTLGTYLKDLLSVGDSFVLLFIATGTALPSKVVQMVQQVVGHDASL